jgi:hypothetical protein
MGRAALGRVSSTDKALFEILARQSPALSGAIIISGG